jgi:hypothetical protein
MKRIKRPCDECPWRVDAQSGRFTPERWGVLRASSLDEDTGFGPDYGNALFACHKSPEGGERACAGWLAVEGSSHPNVRLAVLTGDIPICSLEPGEDWPDLYPSFAEASAHDLEGS